ncbi:Mobile element protein [Azospirillum doebereinerae]
MRQGFLYLVAVMDWATRKVLIWRLSNTMDVEFCIQAVEEAMARQGQPDIFDTDRGSRHSGVDGWTWPVDGTSSSNGCGDR